SRWRRRSRPRSSATSAWSTTRTGTRAWTRSTSGGRPSSGTRTDGTRPLRRGRAAGRGRRGGGRRRPGRPVRRLLRPPRRARRRFPFANDAVEQAHYRAGDGFVDAAALARGLVLGGGFDTFTAAPAEAVEVSSGRVAGVRTASGRRVATRTVVLAGGPFTRRLAEAAGAPLPV